MLVDPAAAAPAPAPGAQSPPSRKQGLAATALAFEQLLVRQLAAQLARATEDDDEPGADAALVTNLVPDALAEGVAAAGGVGLASELQRALERSS